MSDVTYDAIIIGGGTKGLLLAMYLAKYGGMDVAIFERRHEAGGGWASDEGAAPAFIGDYHASSTSTAYNIPIEQDFPEWLELAGKYIDTTTGTVAIFREDDSFLTIYNTREDPSQVRTAESIAKFSSRDADTWLGRMPKLFNAYKAAMLEWAFNPPPPPDEPDALDKLFSNPEFDPSWKWKSPLEVARDLFESDALITFILRAAMTPGFFPNTSGNGWLAVLNSANGLSRESRGIVGGTHSWAHAAVKIFLANRGKIFTEYEVDKVLINNGAATGVRLKNGTEIGARKLVVSTLDPYTLCFRLIGKENLNWQILRRVENLDRRGCCIAWYTWALNELPEYKAAAGSSEINKATAIFLIDRNPECLVREQSTRELGIMPDDLQLRFQNYLNDKTRAPAGKYTLLSEQFLLPANALSEEQWLKFKKSHAEEIMKLWQKHTTNMSWDKVIGYVPLTPYDSCDLANMAPTGNWAIIDHHLPSQMGRFRPIPELAHHRTPIKNLYATGSAWPPLAAGASWQGYNCYKIIASDLKLEEPWKRKGRLF